MPCTVDAALSSLPPSLFLAHTPFLSLSLFVGTVPNTTVPARRTPNRYLRQSAEVTHHSRARRLRSGKITILHAEEARKHNTARSGPLTSLRLTRALKANSPCSLLLDADGRRRSRRALPPRARQRRSDNKQFIGPRTRGTAAESSGALAAPHGTPPTRISPGHRRKTARDMAARGRYADAPNV